MEAHEAEWYPGKINPHPLGSAPERFEKAMTPKERQHRDREDAKKLEGLQKRLQQAQVRVSSLRAARDSGRGQHAERNVLYVNSMNRVIELREEIAQLFVEQDQ